MMPSMTNEALLRAALTCVVLKRRHLERQRQKEVAANRSSKKRSTVDDHDKDEREQAPRKRQSRYGGRNDDYDDDDENTEQDQQRSILLHPLLQGWAATTSTKTNDDNDEVIDPHSQKMARWETHLTYMMQWAFHHASIASEGTPPSFFSSGTELQSSPAWNRLHALAMHVACQLQEWRKILHEKPRPHQPRLNDAADSPTTARNHNAASAERDPIEAWIRHHIGALVGESLPLGTTSVKHQPAATPEIYYQVWKAILQAKPGFMADLLVPLLLRRLIREQQEMDPYALPRQSRRVLPDRDSTVAFRRDMSAYWMQLLEEAIQHVSPETGRETLDTLLRAHQEGPPKVRLRKSSHAQDTEMDKDKEACFLCALPHHSHDWASIMLMSTDKSGYLWLIRWGLERLLQSLWVAAGGSLDNRQSLGFQASWTSG